MNPKNLLAAALLSAGTAQAHHSAVMFDHSKCVVISGTVRAFLFEYPHSWLWLTVPDSQGGSSTWAFEFPAPAGLVMSDPTHWKPGALPKGMKVTAYAAPMRDGRQGGLMNSVVLPNGYRMHAAPDSVTCEEKYYGVHPGDEVLKKIGAQ